MGPITQNMIFYSARNKMLSGTMVNLATANVSAALVSSSFLLSFASEETSYAGAVGDHAIVTSSLGAMNITTIGALPTYNVAVSASAGTVTFSNVTNGSTSECIVVFVSGTADEPLGLTDPLLAIYLTNSVGSKIAITGNGGDVTVNWNAEGVFGLSCS